MRTGPVASFTIAVALLIFGTGPRAFSRTTDTALPERAIRDLLHDQVEAWNRGDIDAFMSGYDKGEKTTFVSGDEIHHGWETVLARYKARYPDKATMGKLTFSDLKIPLIAPNLEFAVATGRWELRRAKDKPRGRFTLLLRRTEGGHWRIIYDHTSSAEPKK